MIQLIMLLLVLCAIWFLLKMAKGLGPQHASEEEARSIGLQEASLHIHNPILLEDYAQAKGLSLDLLHTLIRDETLPSYLWRQFTFVENRDLAFAPKKP